MFHAKQPRARAVYDCSMAADEDHQHHHTYSHAPPKPRQHGAEQRHEGRQEWPLDHADRHGSVGRKTLEVEARPCRGGAYVGYHT